MSSKRTKNNSLDPCVKLFNGNYCNEDRTKLRLDSSHWLNDSEECVLDLEKNILAHNHASLNDFLKLFSTSLKELTDGFKVAVKAHLPIS